MSSGLLARAEKLLRITAADRPAKLPNDIRELTGFNPRPLQQKMADEMRRFNSWVVHRRFGKSVLAINTLIERGIECPFDNGRYAYLGPTEGQVERIAWTYAKDYAAKIPLAEIQESKKTILLPTRRGHRAEISLYGVDSPKQRLRGMYLDGVVLDEWAQIPPHVWSQQVSPMLTDVNRAGYDDLMNRNQWAIFIFTPFGRNHAYKMHQKATLWSQGLGAKVGTNEMDSGDDGVLVYRDDWSAQLWRASETGVLAADELARARSDADSVEEFEQEFECSFDAAVKGSIFGPKLAEMRAAGHVKSGLYNPALPVHTGWDLGYDDATAIWFCQLVGMEVRVVDYYEMSGAGLDHYADVLERKAYRYGKHYLPHDVEVTELGTNKSRASVLRGMGVRVTTVGRSNKEDAIAAARQLIPRCYWDSERTTDGYDKLALYQRDYDPRQQVFRLKPKHNWASHSADAFQTLALGLKKQAPGAGDYQSARAEL